MQDLERITDAIRQDFENRTQARDRALLWSRSLTRCAAFAIRALHREEWDEYDEQIRQGQELLNQMRQELEPLPDLYYAGYTQDAIKEYVEARITNTIIRDLPLPGPDELGVESATYLKGMAEVPGELRRRCLDILRSGYSQEAERLLACMDDIYAVLVTMDYPDAITNGLRRQTDLVRGIVERTRGDMTISIREEQLKASMDALQARLDQR